MTMSAPKLARPVTLSTPSGRMGRVPTTFCNSFGIYVMRTLLLFFVAPAKAGAQGKRLNLRPLDSRFRGNDGMGPGYIPTTLPLRASAPLRRARPAVAAATLAGRAD